MKKLWVAGMAATLALSAGASVIGVNFDASGGSMDSSDLAGAPGVRVGNWNNWTTADKTMGDTETVVDNGGATVAGFTATINWANKWTSRDANNVNDQGLYSDVIDVDGGPFLVDIANIPYAQYNVYVYMRDDGADRAGSFAIGTTTYYARGGLGNPATDGTGYVRLLPSRFRLHRRQPGPEPCTWPTSR